MSTPSDPFYTEHAQALARSYDELSFVSVHGGWLHRLPSAGGAALDVGAGTGRDAEGLADRGFEVVAVEPNDTFRAHGEVRGGQPIHWVTDQLPSLTAVTAMNRRFDLVLLNAVWMHVAPAERAEAFRRLTALLAPGALLVISYRQPRPGDAQRALHPPPPGELPQLARGQGLEVVEALAQPDQLRRADVTWQTLVMQAPATSPPPLSDAGRTC
jgi:SAM-dependent methyltransferase